MVIIEQLPECIKYIFSQMEPVSARKKPPAKWTEVIIIVRSISYSDATASPDSSDALAV